MRRLSRTSESWSGDGGEADLGTPSQDSDSDDEEMSSTDEEEITSTHDEDMLDSLAGESETVFKSANADDEDMCDSSSEEESVLNMSLRLDTEDENMFSSRDGEEKVFRSVNTRKTIHIESDSDSDSSDEESELTSTPLAVASTRKGIMTGKTCSSSHACSATQGLASPFEMSDQQSAKAISRDIGPEPKINHLLLQHPLTSGWSFSLSTTADTTVGTLMDIHQVVYLCLRFTI